LEIIMKSLVYAVIAATALSASAAAMAQGDGPAVASVSSGQPVTRAQVRAELVALEKAGFRPGLSDPNYPADVQAAEARVHAGDSSYGPQAADVSDAGGAVAPAAWSVPAHGSLYGGGR
jgi:hypothetical protein